MNITEQRLENLEIKMMDLENSLSQLNQVIIRQAEEISALQQMQQRLLGQLDALEHRRIPADEEPPPHY